MLKTIGGILLLISTAAFIYLLCTPPHPANAVQLKISYKTGNQRIFRDPAPVDERDRMLLTCYNPYLKKVVPLEPKYTNSIEDLYWLVQLSDLLKTGPQLSDNYVEKFEHIQMMHKAKILFSIVFIGVSIALIIIGVLLPESPGEGEIRRAGKIIKISDLHKKRLKQNNID